MKPTLYVSGTDLAVQDGHIQPLEDKSVIEGKKVLTGQVDSLLAHSWALRNYGANIVFSLGKMEFQEHAGIAYAIARNREEFLNSLYREGDRIGGFIHQVDPANFELRADRIGQTKWFAQEPAKVLQSCFVSLQEVMNQSVQVYILEDPQFATTLAAGRKQHPVLVREGLESGALSCLNKEYGCEPIPIPAEDMELKRAEPGRPPRAGLSAPAENLGKH